MKTSLSVRLILILSAAVARITKFHNDIKKNKINQLTDELIGLETDRSGAYSTCLEEITEARHTGESLASELRTAALNKKTKALEALDKALEHNSSMYQLLLKGA